MLSTSLEFRAKVAQSSKVRVKADLTLADGTLRELSGDDFMESGLSFSDAVSSAGSFDVGAAIINQARFTLNNYDGRFDEYDFTDSVIVPYVGVELDSGGIEWLRKGVFHMEQPKSYGSTIEISALDAMRAFEQPYSDVGTEYPATLRTIVADMCDLCGVTLDNPGFANATYVVAERPDDKSLTCLSMLSYVGQASGNWARCDTLGRLRLDWYDTAAFDAEDWLDGDRFDEDDPYSSGDDADGGDFDDYGSGDEADAGSFGKSPWTHVYAYSEASVAVDDVCVTGVRVTAADKHVEGGSDLDGETALYGQEGYVIELSGNPLVQYGEARRVADQVGVRVAGMRFRPFDASAIGDPAREAGDPVILTDNRQRQYCSYITSLQYKVGAYQALSCNAETPSRRAAAGYSQAEQAISQLKRSLRREQDERQRAIEELASGLGGTGLFMTEDEQGDGSTVYYMHDQPTLAESKVVWKMGANALGISTDGGETYPYGLDVGGTAILNRIYAIGINADYIKTGALTVCDEDGGTVFSADVNTGLVRIGGFTVTNDSIFNDSLQLDAGGLIVKHEGSAIGALRASGYTEGDEVVGYMQMLIPGKFQVVSKTVDEEEPGSLVLDYDKENDIFHVRSKVRFDRIVWFDEISYHNRGVILNKDYGTSLWTADLMNRTRTRSFL